VVAAERELTQRLGRTPTENEIAEQAALRRDEVAAARRAVRRAVRAERRRLERRGQAAQPEPVVHRVQRGESLWAIARARLGAQATNAQVAALVARVWEANERTLRSGDPDLIYPGERLELPR
jgi:nucleoid-associated protein YgaU